MNVCAAQGYERVRSAIAEQRCVILDGGVATELSHEHGQDQEGLWGMESLASAPGEVLQIHRRYVDAGVDVVTANTWALPTMLAANGRLMDDHARSIHWMEVARRGMSVAREAIRQAGREGDVAVAFSLNGDLDRPDGPETVALLARTLADDPPDLILFETLSVLRPSLFDVVAALVESSIPVWLSFRRCRHGLCGVYGQHWGGPEGDAFGRAARRFEEMGVSALLANCIPPDHVEGIISILRDFTDMPLGVYPNLGYYTNAGWQTESKTGGEEYAEMALRWRSEGAQIIGGCCGTQPEHIAAAREALAKTHPGRERLRGLSHAGNRGTVSAVGSVSPWTDPRGRSLYPLRIPVLASDPETSASIPGTLLTWRYLFQEGIGAHQRCLDVGSGAGLQTIQLALNGANHVHAIDINRRAVAKVLDNAFRHGVADRVSGEVADIYPWVPDERYEVVVANLPQVPVDPMSELVSHRPVDYWGRGLVDQVIGKLPGALAVEGRALVALTSLLSRARTLRLLAEAGLTARVVAWEVTDLPPGYLAQRAQIARITELSDGYVAEIGNKLLLVTYLLEITHRETGSAVSDPPWSSRP